MWVITVDGAWYQTKTYLVEDVKIQHVYNKILSAYLEDCGLSFTDYERMEIGKEIMRDGRYLHTIFIEKTDNFISFSTRWITSADGYGSLQVLAEKKEPIDDWNEKIE